MSYTIETIFRFLLQHQIFVTTHNRADLLPYSLDSLLNQTAGVKNITVLDNESTDNTEAVVKKYKKVSYVETSGFLGNYRTARKLCNKPFCMIFHDDDLMHPQYLEFVLNILNHNPNVSMVTCSYTEFRKSMVSMPQKLDDGYYLFKQKGLWAAYMYFFEMIAYAPAVYKTEAFLKHDVDYELYGKFNDWPMMAKMAREGDVAFIPDRKAFYVRRHSGQDTWTFNNQVSVEQIVNWDLFFYKEMGAYMQQEPLYMAFLNKVNHFLKGKYKCFLTEETRKKYSYADCLKLLENKGVKFNVSLDKVAAGVSGWQTEMETAMQAIQKNIFKKYVCDDYSQYETVNLKDKIQIMLITYNRSYYLERTLKQLLADSSPVKDFDITILNNASTDGTDGIITKYQNKFPNIKHIKHFINIGGNANVVRAFELGATSGKEYVWVLCDDDYCDFSGWNEVKKNIIEGADCIGVARYVFKNNQLDDPASQILQLTFVPAGIYKTSLITDTVLTNMYDTIYTMFPQSCLVASLINDNKKISFLKNPIMELGIHREDTNAPTVDASYTRGSDFENVSFRRKEQTWLVGYANIIRLLKNKNLQYDCMETAIGCSDICVSWEQFYGYMQQIRNMTYFNEIMEVLSPGKRKDVLEYIKHPKKVQACKNILRWFFELKNSGDRKHKVLTIFGIKFKFKRKKVKRC